MNRRSFFSRLLPSAATIAVAPTILIPRLLDAYRFKPVRGVLTQQMIDDCMRDLEDDTACNPHTYFGTWRWVIEATNPWPHGAGNTLRSITLKRVDFPDWGKPNPDWKTP